jgi:hypothetical protein
VPSGFVINQNGVVFEKDLGKETVQATAAISEFNPDKSWKARGVTAILEEKRSFGKNRGSQVCESQTTSLEISAAEGACRRN